MAYPAIRTKFLGATNTKPARVKATVETPPYLGQDRELDRLASKFFTNVSLPYDDDYDQFTNHQRVAEELAFRFFNAYRDEDDLRVSSSDIDLVAGAVDRGYIWVRVCADLVQLS